MAETGLMSERQVIALLHFREPEIGMFLRAKR
jgi:hypothetical protein